MSKKKSKSFPKEGKGKKYLFEQIYQFFQKNPSKVFNHKQIAAALDVKDPSERILVNIILDELAEKELLRQPERGKFMLKSNRNSLTGQIQITSGGNAYLISEESEQDIFIAQRYLDKALDGDTVKVHLFPYRGKGKPEGEVIEIIKRNRTEFVGNIQISPQFAFVVPDSNKVDVDFFIPQQKLNNARNGQKVVIRMTEWKDKTKSPMAEVIKVLGDPGDNDTEIHAILEEYGLPYEFPEVILKASEAIPRNITDEEIQKRRDFRGITTFTIDPADAKDFDDALSIRHISEDVIEIGVHIADVTHYLKEGSKLDEEAYRRATSVYLVDRVVPMLPEVLSNDLCSLRPNEDKLCFSAVFEMNKEAKVLKSWFGRTVIHSIRRFTYEEAQEVIETGNGDLKEEILEMHRLASILRKERFENGAVNFEKQEVKFKLDDKGKPLGVYFKIAKEANHLIEEFMLLANKKVAEFVGKTEERKNRAQEEKTFVYRVHDLPNNEKLETFLQLVRSLGYKFNSGNSNAVAQSLNKLMKEVKDKPESNMVETLAIRVMSKAYYSTDNIGHYGLAFDYYTHFTSPIRRYPDVMVHRLLQRYLDKQESADKDFYEECCVHSSDMEKTAADAERASIKYKQVEFLKDKIGMQFTGIISGVTEFGLFVELEVNKCEGMVRLRDIPGDYFELDEANYCVYGRRTGRKLQLGDRIMVEIKTADLVKKQLEFELAD